MYIHIRVNTTERMEPGQGFIHLLNIIVRILLCALCIFLHIVCIVHLLAHLNLS